MMVGNNRRLFMAIGWFFREWGVFEVFVVGNYCPLTMKQPWVWWRGQRQSVLYCIFCKHQLLEASHIGQLLLGF
jgi:hypothetical protein